MYQVIVVDDEAKIRSGIAHLFPWKQLGFEIAGVFANGKEALDFLELHPVDLILSDIRMPLMDGLELSSRLCELQPAPRIIFFSGYQDFDYARQAIKNGVFDYLLKPVKYEDLLDCLTRIRELLDQERGKPEAQEESLSYYDKIISTVQNYLDAEYQTATLEQAARLINLSPNYLSKLMKEHSDQSFSDYLLKTRMENAARMLENIQYKQYEIAYRVGYDNPKNFSRAFHQYYHMTPSEYRAGQGRKEK